MRKKYILFVLLLAIFNTSCVDEFINAPDVVSLDLEKVFSSKKSVEGAIALAYAYNLSSGLPIFNWSPPYMPFGTSEAFVGGEDLSSVTWTYEPAITGTGMTAATTELLQGAALSDDNFPNNYQYIRHACIILENVDKVPDMNAEEKKIIKGEMKGLIAFRHLEMLKRYGGVPCVDHTLTVVDFIKRSSVQETLDFIVKLSDESAELLKGHTWSNDWNGRLTEGVALAIKAEVLTFAARPLFNSATPYMDFSPHNDLICFGNYDSNRWQKAIDANLAVIEWGKQNGYELINTGNPFEDYGMAVGVPGSKEVLLAYKQQGDSKDNTGGGMMAVYCPNPQWGGTVAPDYRGTSYEMLIQYRKEDGTNQTWAGTTEQPYQDYYDRAQEMEPRFKASIFCFGIDPWNNPNDNFWSVMQKSKQNQGIGRNIKFWYKAGTRTWFEFPIYRMSEFYLNIAEAYNGMNDDVNSRKYLNIIRNRGGLNDLTTQVGEDLKNEIYRDWEVEFYNENQHYPHARHWKRGDTMIGGAKHVFNFTYISAAWGVRVPADFLTYKLAPATVPVYAWYDKMYLSPFPQVEMNKGYLVQNPGY